jgi:hypothetical protein
VTAEMETTLAELTAQVAHLRTVEAQTRNADQLCEERER